MGRQRRPTALVLVAFLPLLLAPTPTAAAAESSNACIGDFAACTGRAKGIATGDGFELGLYVPGRNGGARDVSGGASSCPGCRWEIVPSCEDNTPGTGDNDTSCAQAVLACAGTGGTLVEVYLKRPGEPWRTVNSYCSNPAQPITTPAQIAALAADRFADMALPAPDLSSQPPGGTAVNLPTVFWSADLEPVTITVTLRGFTASLTATPSAWTWDFGDGEVLTTSTPGAPYPHQSITHTFRRRGDATVRVTTTWAGSVVVEGMGALPIAETVSRTTSRQVTVREARTELVSDSQ